MDNQKKQVVDKLKEAKNVLVTVSSNPTVDQLAACLGLTLMLNKLGKHASAVFSGEVPSTIEFLKPEDTLETNTNSLRDFIIALDRNKADKLRYKVEDKVVRIFITPYKTSISQDDLEFSEGDFNVDVVIALGVKQQQDIDQAVTAHGNILHDATVITLTTSDESGLGSIHWRDPAASGVSELAASMAGSFDKDLLDEQIATAFLTGIVAQTDRFSNNLTSSQTMTVSAQLMGAGANQQLVATKLEEPQPAPEPVQLPAPEDSEPEPTVAAEPEPAEDEPKADPGMLQIDHNQPLEDVSVPAEADAGEPAPESGEQNSRGKILEGDGPDASQLTASADDDKLDPSTDPFSLPEPGQAILSHDSGKAKPKEKEPDSEDKTDKSNTPEPKEPPQAQDKHPQTLDEIETSVHSPHLDTESSDQPLPGVSIDENGMLVHHTADAEPNALKPAPGFESTDKPLDIPSTPPQTDQDQKNDDAPPPVPPPIV